MPEDFVTNRTCELRIDKQNLLLSQISRDSSETREAMGKIARKMFEGNGVEAFDVQIRQNSNHRAQMEGRAEAHLRFGWAKRLGWATAGAGWMVALLVWGLSRVL